MIAVLLACTISAVAAVPQDALEVKARLRTKKLESGKSYEFVVKTKLAKGLKTDGAGMPSPILQLDVPDCVKLEGDVLTDHRDLARNEFMHAPFEFLMKENIANIPFTLVSEPGPNDVIGISVVAYINGKDGNSKTFVRQRVNLPVAPKAKSKPADPAISSWGGDLGFLQIGDQATDFTLPRSDGSKVHLADFKGKHVIITTYRAFW